MRRILAIQLGLVFIVVAAASGQDDAQPPPGVNLFIGSAEADAIGPTGTRQKVGSGRIIIVSQDVAVGESFQQQRFPGNISVWVVENEDQAKRQLTDLFNEAHKNENIVPGTLRIILGAYRKGNMIERIGNFVKKFTPVMVGRDATRVHVLLACDTDAGGGIAPGVRVNQQRMEQFFAEAFRGREDILDLKVLTGNDVNPNNVLNYYRYLNSQPTEILVFYYSGHGGAFNNGRTLEHFLAMSHGGDLVRSGLLGEMQKKPHQCLILLTDCCSSTTGYDENEMKQSREKLRDLFGKPIRGSLGDLFGRPVDMPPAFDKRTVDSLFLRHEGTIDITAATPTRDQFSWTNDRLGGFFTYALVGVLRSNVDDINTGRGRVPGVVNWQQAYGKIQPWAAALSLGRSGLPPLEAIKNAPPRERDRLWQWAYAFSFH